MFKRIRNRGGRAFATLGAAIAVLSLATSLTLTGMQGAQANPRYAAYVVDVHSGKALFSRYAGERRYPASLTKMMTLYMVFEQLAAGRLRLDDTFTMTSHAASMPPTKLGIRAGGKIRVEDAIKALVTKSANDVAAAIGDNMAGSEAQFASRMTKKARALGMSSTTFKNASGLPDSGQVTTARDMALLGIALNQHFPQYYGYFSTKSFRYNGHTYGNHNRLLGSVSGVDGIKTGYIRASGFNLVSSVRRDGRHVVAVVMGGRSSRTRDAHMRELIAGYVPKASPRRTDPLLIARTPVFNGIDLASVPRPQSRPPMNVVRTASADPDSIMMAMAAAQPAVEQGSAAPAAAQAYAPGGGDAGLDAAIATGGTWLVQIAAVAAKDDAIDMLSSAKAKVGAALAEARPHTETVVVEGTTLYRARFAGLDESAARSACEALKRNRYACFPIKN